MDVDLADGADESATQHRANVQMEKRFVILERSRPDARLDQGRKPLIDQMVETHHCGGRDSAVFALLQFQIEEPLRLTKWTVDGLVVMLPRPGLRVTPLIDADKPGGLSARNDLPCFPGPWEYLLPGNGHTTGTYSPGRSGFIGILLLACQWPAKSDRDGISGEKPSP